MREGKEISLISKEGFPLPEKRLAQSILMIY